MTHPILSLDAQVCEWNRKHRPGSLVRLVDARGHEELVFTRSEAEVTPSKQAVVFLRGYESPFSLALFG